MEFLKKLFRPPIDRSEAQQAIADADERLVSAQDQNKQVNEIVAELREHRRVNHFAQRIEASIAGRAR